MLIEFNVTNFRSFQETQKLSMAATSAKNLQAENTFSTKMAQLPRLLKSAVIYGPNAAGKSNLINAMRFMKQFVLFSAKYRQEGEKITDVKPFLFNSQTSSQPSTFEMLFMQEGVFYQYGFAVNPIRVTNEWLFAYPKIRAQHWFSRDYDPSSGQDKWYFGNKFKGSRQLLQKATRSNALFLSTAIQLNNEQLKPVFNWFQQKLAVIGLTSQLIPTLSIEQCKKEAGKQKIMAFLNAADLSIADVQLKTRKFDEQERDLPKRYQSRRNEWDESVQVFYSMNDIQERVAFFLDDDESDGTQKLFAIAGPWLDVLENGKILVVDELESSLHPLMVRFLVSLLHNPEINKHNAQLIFTAHETSILESQLLRRDQIWFLEKNRENATQLYPLSDFIPRNGEVFGKSYLNGRYGALPNLTELEI
jgi:AAA15 family ATPase/GTPase